MTTGAAAPNRCNRRTQVNGAGPVGTLVDRAPLARGNVRDPCGDLSLDAPMAAGTAMFDTFRPALDRCAECSRAP